jgi:aminoglycoside phosphotransferase (APT) family kinase protein
MPDDTTLTAATIARTVRLVNPNWTLTGHEPASGGYLPVHVLDLDTPSGPRRAVLKVSPDGESHGIDVEARLLRLLDTHTTIPVPKVYGVVDDHPDLPAPCFLAAHAPGVTVERDALDTLPTGRLEHLARVSGRYLAELHSLEPFEAFGFLRRNPARTLRGERPPTSFDAVAVADPTPSWRTQVRAWADDPLAGLADTRFADLRGDLRPFVDERTGRLDDSVRPVLGHVDNSIENVRHDPATGEVTAMLDWAFSLSVTPAYDLVLVEQSLRGGQQRFLPDAPDLVDRVRPPLLAGYREAAPSRSLDELATHRDLYELLSLLRSMNNLEPWLDVKGVTPAELDAAATAVRERALALVDG